MKSRNLATNLALIGLTALLAPLHAARATTFVEQNFTCPVGGKKFKAPAIASNSTFGQRPDGRPYSPLPVVPMVECPDNGFPLYQEKFSKEEIAKAAALIGSETYRKMRTEESQYYRLWWLRREMGADPYDLARHLMVAGWETDGNPTRKVRYQTAFVEAVVALDPKAQPEEAFWLTLRAANALRELERFEQASKLLALLPERAPAVADAEARTAGLRIAKDLGALIDARMSGSEPLTLVPDHVARIRCVLYSEALVAVERPVCDRANVREAISQTEITTEDGKDLKGEEAIRYLARGDAHLGDVEH